MPIYEYECEKCSRSFEILQRSDEKVSCPSCGGNKLRKLFSTFSCPTATAGLKECAGGSPACSAEQCKSGMCPFSGQ